MPLGNGQQLLPVADSSLLLGLDPAGQLLWLVTSGLGLDHVRHTSRDLDLGHLASLGSRLMMDANGRHQETDLGQVVLQHDGRVTVVLPFVDKIVLLDERRIEQRKSEGVK